MKRTQMHYRVKIPAFDLVTIPWKLLPRVELGLDWSSKSSPELAYADSYEMRFREGKEGVHAGDKCVEET